MEQVNFCRSNEEAQGEPLHYPDCGLDNIYLVNGFDWDEYDGDRYLKVYDLDGLHQAIGLHIVLDKKAPTGQEMRFLRTEMELSQAELGAKLGVSDQSIARWEKGHTDVPGTAVFAFKMLYVFWLIPEDVRAEIANRFVKALDELAQDDETNDDIVLSYNHNKWLDTKSAA